MRKISDTIARLGALKAQHMAASTRDFSRDRLSVLAAFGSNPGALQAKYYCPENLAKGAPLVVVLHGCTQDASGYDHHSGWSQLADEAGFAVLYPEQQRGNNPNLCFNWFVPADTKRDSGEALSVRQMIEAVVNAHGLDRKRIFVTGLSAGGGMAAAMLATYPELFAGGGIVAGLPYASATTVPEAFDRVRGHGGPSSTALQALLRSASDHRGPWPKISIWQGSADHTVASSNAAAIAAQWQAVHKLDKRPSYSKVSGRLAKKVWSDASGEPVIEINMIDGMGHGTPLGSDGLGTPGAYMLDVGISSTREIAQFWGIAAHTATIGERSMPKAPLADRQPRAKVSPPQEAGVPGVKTIIEDALRAAGLMR